MQPMAATNNTTQKFMHHLSMALCEWFLIFLMFMDAALGYILTKFAHHCELQSPCMFCLRLDHVFGEKPESFLSLFCNKHRAEVSNLISCQLHHTLADVREMCDDCFISIMKQNNNKKPFLNNSFVRVPSCNGTCSCCKIEWKPKPRSGLRLGVLKIKTKPTMSLGGARGKGRFRLGNDYKRTRDAILGNSTPYHLENNFFMDMDVDMDTDALSDSGCADLRFYSGSDSDDSFYEVDCGEDGCYYDDFRIVNDKSILNQDQVRQEQPCSVSNFEPLVQNVDPKGIITGHESLESDGSIGVKENSPLQVGKETRDYNQDFDSFKDHKEIDENGHLEVNKETRDHDQDLDSFKDHKAIGVNENDSQELSKETKYFNQDFYSFKDHNVTGLKENDLLEVSKEKKDYNQDFHSFKDHNKEIGVKENSPLEVIKETGDYNQNQDLHSFEDHKEIAVNKTRDYNDDFQSFKDHEAIGVKEINPLEVGKETKDYNQDFQSFKDQKAIDEKENGPLEVSKETKDYNQDFQSFKDQKAIDGYVKGPLEVSKETKDYNQDQDLNSFKDHKTIDEKENGPLEVINETKDFNRDFYSFKDHDAIGVKENDPLEVINETRDYNQDQELNLFKDHNAIDEKENGPLEVINETKDFNRDFYSFKDPEAIGVKENDPLEMSNETRDYNQDQDLHSYKDHKAVSTKDNGPLEVINETKDFNRDFYSFKDHEAIGVKENGPLEVNKETRDYNQDQDLHSSKDHEAVGKKDNGPLEVINETKDFNQDFNSSKDHEALNVKVNGPLEVKKEPKDFNQVFYSFKYQPSSPSSDKHEGYESPGSSGVSEIEGEGDIEKLKRQVGHYQERLRLLQKELEEERNAAAIAADEAMAMITRLQEEKASLHMEASQYLRMMDEQAEYDMEALDKANDLVAEKDKEIQDLENELEYFRNRYEDELFKDDDDDDNNNKVKENRTENGKIEVNSSFILGLEEEKKYILQSLTDLKRKFDQFSNGNVTDDNGLLIDDEVDVGTLENDILDLNERLETLEADRDFLEHACNMLQSKGGLEFVQEIAHHLHDSRRVRFDRRC